MPSLPSIAAAAAAALTLAGTLAAPAAEAASSKRWLLVHAAPGDPKLADQTALFQTLPDSDFRERDLVVLQVLPDGETKVLRGTPGTARPAIEAQGGAGMGFTVVLIGKDGGAKWRENRPARPAELFALIDAMPMRANEMKRNGAGG